MDDLATLNRLQSTSPQQIATDMFTTTEEYAMHEKAFQDYGLGYSQSAGPQPECALSEGLNEPSPYWALLDIPPPSNINGGLDFGLGPRLPRSVFRVNKESQFPVLATGISPPPEDGSPNDQTASIPTVVMRDCPRLKPAMITEGMRQNLISNLLAMGCDKEITTKIPSSTVLQNCMRAYFERFDIHVGLFHLPTLNIGQLDSPLTLAMCAIGALYRLDRRLSAFLFLTAERAVNMFSFQRDGDSASPSFETQDLETLGKQPMGNFKPVWELQTRVLVFIATLGGKPTFSRKAVDGIGRKFSLPLYFSSLSNGLTDSFEVLACEYRILASRLQRDTWHTDVSWHRWVDRESMKRVLYAILRISNILNFTYGVPPITSVVQEYDIDMPDADELWHAPSEIDWTLAIQGRPRDKLPSLRSAVSQLLYGEAPPTVYGLDQWSPYAHRNLDGVNANLHGAEAIRSLLTSNIEIGLARCYLMISKARTTNELTWNEAEGPLLFNSLSILRGIHVRVLTGLCGVDRMVLLNDVEEDVTMAVTDYVTSSSTRDRATVRSVHSLFDNIMTILKLDANILRKTAAFNWSVEHAIVGVDCGK
ncbi:hypothetical protein N7513_013167 [Penicillium frequentans]|nr:hypothetical protein N7513_013167 [Penicillium glabrum]